MNVLSLFDGMSCGQLALKRANIPYKKYFASEIDKYAIQITQKNFPDTVQLGDVNNWMNWNLPKIDLLLGGSPCQGFSVAGYGLNFSDPRSQLFFRYVDCLQWYKPTWFLLENVKMKKEWQEVISNLLGVQPIEIDSALVSAQSRKRLYWTNIPNITQPEDKGILLKDIIEDGVVDRDKSYCIDANYWKGGSLKGYKEKKRRQLVMHQSEKRLMIQVGSLYKNNGDAGRVYSVEGKGRTLKVDAIIEYTDNETWAGGVHVFQHMNNYRRSVAPEAKFIDVVMVANEGTLRDPKDTQSLEVVGFDPNVPVAINGFLKGEL